MRDEIKNEFDIEPALIEGGGGIFDVTVDGKLIFSKSIHFRFPEPGKISEMIRDKKS